ncbi:MAG: hypothetical protein AAFP19_16195 [Bacteroidota bacterium]
MKMNSLHPVKNQAPIVENIYGIIDTKIQYIDYQTNQIVSTITGVDFQRVQKPDIEVGMLNDFNFAHNGGDSFITLMAEYSKSKALLLLMRTELDQKNAQAVLDLLTDNKFIHFSEVQLLQKLKTAGLSE